MGNRIEVIIRNETYTNEIYEEKFDEYSSILENAANIGPFAARKYKIRKSRVKDLRRLPSEQQGAEVGDQEL